MALNTVEQVRRVFRVVAGFTLLAAGAVMLVTPGPGWLVIFLGLGLLAAEFMWARRLMDRIKREGSRFKDTVLGKPENEKGGEARTSAADQPFAVRQETRSDAGEHIEPGNKGIG
jgi:Putative transmembrane protein (PGPGW).